MRAYNRQLCMHTMDIGVARPEELPAIVSLWNETFEPVYPLRLEVLQQLCRSRYQDPELLLVARDGGRPVGVIAGKAPEVSWLSPDIGFVSYIVVARAYRKQGIGRALYERLAKRLVERGCRHVCFGGDPAHLLPGVPQEAPPETWTFLRRIGARPSETMHDLLLDLRLPLPPRPGRARLRVAGPAEALAFLDRVFSGRWRADMEEHLAAGGTVLALDVEGRMAGFAGVYLPGQPWIGPSQFWSATLPGPAAGLGPLGLEREVRGQGLGLELVIGAAEWLRDQGSAFVVIDWTNLAAFYGRAGAHVWRTYQRAVAELPTASPVAPA